MAEIPYKNEVYRIVGICMEIHKTLGYGFLEIVYTDTMELEFHQNKIPYTREQKYNVIYKGVILKHKFLTDFMLFDDIVVEIKANADGITNESITQTLNYLKASNIGLGLIVNFGKKELTFKRLIF